MKTLVTLILLLSSLGIQSQVKFPKVNDLIRWELHFVALDQELKNIDRKDKIELKDYKMLQTILGELGGEVLNDYGPRLLERLSVGSAQYLVALNDIKANRMAQAQTKLGTVTENDLYYPEANFLLASIGEDLNPKFIDRCLTSAAERYKENTNKFKKRYYQTLIEDCKALKARKLFGKQKYQESLIAYNQISKQDYKWPVILQEKAWVFYQLNDYNRSLGLLVTYKSPLFSSYFSPEAELLTALNYFKLCLYQDAMVVVEQYDNKYRPEVEALNQILRNNQKSKKYFYDLTQVNYEKHESIHPFLHQLVLRITHRPMISKVLAHLFEIEKEIAIIKDFYKDPNNKAKDLWRPKAIGHLQAMTENLKGRINFLVQKEIVKFVNEVIALQEEMFKVRLEIIAKEKNLVYTSKKLIADRSRGDFSQLKRHKLEYFWKFQGEFWADEIGDYSFGLKSNCELVPNMEDENV